MQRFFQFASCLALTGILAGSATSILVSDTAQAQTANIRVGTLTCKGKGRVGMILGSNETLDCTYAPMGNLPKRALIGTVTTVGLDVGVKGESIMIWGVLGSTSSMPSDALRGSFVGAAADASLGLGAGAKVLIGGNNKSIVLQPLSVQGQTGVNFAIGVTGLQLDPR